VGPTRWRENENDENGMQMWWPSDCPAPSAPSRSGKERRAFDCTLLSFLLPCSALLCAGLPNLPWMDGWMDGCFLFGFARIRRCRVAQDASSSCILNAHERADQVERFEPNMAVRIEMFHVFVFQIGEHEYEY